ncbi:oxidoreductase [Arthrobacter sp. 7749]|nr:oxidoreductase [Arthrobacter sp. 7749]
MSTPATRICLVGIRGFGLRHLENIRALEASGLVVLSCAADQCVQDGDQPLGPNVRMYNSLAAVAASGEPVDIVVLATPINTHFELGMIAVSMGADLLLEKPPTATLAQFEELLAASRQAGTRIQVGFQSLGSHALSAIGELLDSGGIGQLRAVGATGMWQRDAAYYSRSPWAGKRVLNGVQVVDGVITNPLAHAVMTALHIAGAQETTDILQLDTELFHANNIAADDTSTVRVLTKHGIPVTCVLATTAAEQQDPFITISGTEGQAIFHYTRDELAITRADGQTTVHTFGRTDLLTNLVTARRDEATELLSALERTGAFMRVLEAVRTADDPTAINPEHLNVVGQGPTQYVVVPGIEELAQRAIKSPATFSSLGAPWADPAPAGEPLLVAGREVAGVRLGTELSPTNSPRPFLHPVSTLTGTVLTDQQPLDHTWHLGVGVTIQDVDGVNFWGGRTYTREAGGYIWRKDHGHIELLSSTGDEGRRDDTLAWIGPDGQTILDEERTITATPGANGSWELGYDFTLTPHGSAPVALGSPGSNGRVAGGYGGFFWRLPAVEHAEIFTIDAHGEENVHGSVSPWLAFAADFGGSAATLIFHATDDDPWFVRCAGYPGIGRSLAWDTPATSTRENPVSRGVRVIVADGRLGADEVLELLSGAGIRA